MKEKTRIIRYGKLREKVKQEVKILKLKTVKPEIPLENLGRIDKIDKNIILIANQLKNKIFPELIPFIDNQNKENTDLINQEIKNLEKNRTNLDRIYQIHRAVDTNIDHFVAKLTNETFLLQKHRNLIGEKKYLDKLFAENIGLKDEFIEKVGKNFVPIGKNQLVQEILANNKKLENQIRRIEKNLQQKKQKTFWIFLLSLTLVVATLMCVVIYLIIEL